jgi:hypothetical protein
MFAGSEAEIRPFVANIQSGKKARVLNPPNNRKEMKVELLKSAGYKFGWQRESEGVLVTAYLPDLVAIDPGMVDPKGVDFLILPSKAWVEAQEVDAAPLVRHAAPLYPDVKEDLLTSLAKICFLFAVYLDRRCRCPIVADGRFYLQLLLAFLRDGMASLPSALRYYGYDREFGRNAAIGYHEGGCEGVGLVPGIAFRASHETVEQVLAEQVAIFFATQKGGALWRAWKAWRSAAISRLPRVFFRRLQAS